MYTELQRLSTIKPADLDHFLARGWFRMQQTIFTTDQEIFGNTVYYTIWLRVCLANFKDDKKYVLLYKKNSQFTTEIKKGIITPAHEALFSFYKKSKAFERAPSLQWLLLGDKLSNVYDTHMINIYDGNQMIGTGFFDLGKESAAGICCIYHPDYKKYSLGKYMIYEKIRYCKNKGFQYFYPGYFVPGYPLFDYKLTIGKSFIEYFETEKNAWFQLSTISLSDYAPAIIT